MPASEGLSRKLERENPYRLLMVTPQKKRLINKGNILNEESAANGAKRKGQRILEEGAESSFALIP